MLASLVAEVDDFGPPFFLSESFLKVVDIFKGDFVF